MNALMKGRKYLFEQHMDSDALNEHPEVKQEAYRIIKDALAEDGLGDTYVEVHTHTNMEHGYHAMCLYCGDCELYLSDSGKEWYTLEFHLDRIDDKYEFIYAIIAMSYRQFLKDLEGLEDISRFYEIFDEESKREENLVNEQEIRELLKKNAKHLHDKRYKQHWKKGYLCAFDEE